MFIQIALSLSKEMPALLLHLIKDNKIDIYDMPISLITKQYLKNLDLMKELYLEITSKFFNERYQPWSKAFARKTSQKESVFIKKINIFDLLTAIILELIRFKIIKAFQKIIFGKIFINSENTNDNRYNC